MDCITDAARLARRLNVEPNRAEIWRHLKDFAASFGFHHLTVLKVRPDLPEQLAPSIVYIDSPQGFAERFDRERLGPHHPLIARALQDLEPFSCSEASATQLTEAQRRVLRVLGAALDVCDGWTFAVGPDERNDSRDDDAVRGVLMFAGREPDMSLLLRSVLHLLAHRAFRRSEELAGGTDRTHGLTPRELECLRWVALGKTDAEIAVILSISPRTARFHVENAKQKLRADTRIQAVAEAMRLNALAA